MKKFKFQLETLLKVTKMKKEDAEVEFAKSSRILEEEQEKLREMLLDMQKGQLEYAQISKEGSHVTIARVMMFHDFFNWKRDQMENQQQVILRAKNEKQKKLKILMELMSYLKSIEQLREKRLKEYNQEALFEEQKMLDEIGLQLYMRNNGKASEAS